MASLAAAQHHNPLPLRSSRRVEEVRGLLKTRAPPLPHGPGPDRQHHRPHHLVRPLARPPQAHHPRLPPLRLRLGAPSPLRLRVVAHRPALHGPDRLQRHPHRPPRRGEERPVLLPRTVPDPALHPVRYQVRHHRQDQAPSHQPQERPLPPPHLRRRPRPGFLWPGLRIPLLHLPLHRGLHPPLRVGGELRHAVPRRVRVPVRGPGLHPGPETLRAPERRRGGGGDGERDRARDRGAGVEPAGERVVRGAGPVVPDRDRGPVRGHIRDGRGRVVHGAADGRAKRGEVQPQWGRREEVLGAVDMEPNLELLFGTQRDRSMK
ncbi:hypothetical protein QJS10_CPB11g00454 [Acorus calamus]|uniref:Uncharacterized protein n=1 Tax=Acorus calamus TaxID=4465 RepID=A0AAV9DQQ0_ACOCL|nr:hypothetical protein QJS10_CPB11g00454 [Acorus calamus]